MDNEEFPWSMSSVQLSGLKLLTLRMRWLFFVGNLQSIDMRMDRGAWIWIGHVGVSFRRLWRFSSKLMIKIGARKGIRVSQFGPLRVTWEEIKRRPAVRKAQS